MARRRKKGPPSLVSAVFVEMLMVAAIVGVFLMRGPASPATGEAASLQSGESLAWSPVRTGQATPPALFAATGERGRAPSSERLGSWASMPAEERERLVEAKLERAARALDRLVRERWGSASERTPLD